ncbi:hypothetical protein F4779DRAFT_636167 [Xylariaceae sp. FL0662B]|nr:hypothetical protein F4779DRAFT_636167 [Xylariaceae sp. FL0662B]
MSCSFTNSFDFDELTGVRLLPKRPTKNPHSNFCIICSRAGNDDCRHWRIISKEQMFKEYDYEGYKRDPKEWLRNFHKLPNFEGVQVDNDNIPHSASQDSVHEISTPEEEQTDDDAQANSHGSQPENTNDSATLIPVPSSMESETTQLPTKWEPNHDPLVAKYTLPQNDPDFRPLLDRDEGGFVRQSEVNAIMERRPFRTIPMSEVRARYSGIIRVREELAAFERGDDW